MKPLIATIAILLGLPALALAAPAPREGWKDPYKPRRKPPAFRPIPARRPPAASRPTPTVTPMKAPRAAAPAARRPAPRTVQPTPTTPATPTTPRTAPTPPVTTPVVDTPPGPPTVVRRHPVTPQRLWHLRLTAGSHQLLIRHASFNPLKADDLFSQGGVKGDVELWLLPRLVVGAEIGWVGGRFEDTVFDTDTTVLHAHSLRAGLRVGYRLWDSVTPYVRGGFAATWVAARIRTDTQSLGGRALAPGGYALAGVELTLKRSWMRRIFGSTVFTMGVLFEAGWVHLGQFKLDGGKSGAGLVDDYRAGLGKLTLQGVTVNAGLVLAF